MEEKNVTTLMDNLKRIISIRRMDPRGKRRGLEYEEHKKLGLIIWILYSGVLSVQVVLRNTHGKQSKPVKAMETAAASLLEAKGLLSDLLYKEHQNHQGYPSFYGSSLYDENKELPSNPPRKS